MPKSKKRRESGGSSKKPTRQGPRKTRKKAAQKPARQAPRVARAARPATRAARATRSGTQGSQFRNLVFEGGGVKGIAYVGALEVLEAKGILPGIERVAGASAGAINATLLGLGYDHAEMLEILQALDFENFLDDSWGVFRDSSRLLSEFGWYKGDFFREWIGERIEAKTGNANATFNDVHEAATRGAPFLDVYFIGTNLSTRFAEVYSYKHTPRMCIADAVRISMSIPLFFAAMRSPRRDVLVDGGVLDNYPVKLFDRLKYITDDDQPAAARRPEYYEEHNAALAREGYAISDYVYNRQTLGFRLDSKTEIATFRDQAEPPASPIDGFFDYTWALIQTVLSVQAQQHLHSDDWQRTIYIDTLGVQTTDFGLGDDTKRALIDSGRDGAADYFAWYEDPESAPVNRF